MSLFKKKSPNEVMREQNRVLRKAQRDLERDRRDIEKFEQQLEKDIKVYAKKGDKQMATRLAKQLVQVRKQKARSFSATSKITSIGAQTKTMQSSAKLANVMGATAKVMGTMNEQMKPQELAQTLQAFEKENTKMALSGEIMDDSMNAVFDESGDEEEQDAIVNQVLDEIGIETIGKMVQAPAAHGSSLGESSRAKANLPTDEEIERQLAQLKTT